MSTINKQYLEIYKTGLLENIIPFWIKHCIDWEDGGFTFCLDRDGTVIDTDKGVWQTGRFTWMILTLYNEVEQKKEWLERLQPPLLEPAFCSRVL